MIARHMDGQSNRRIASEEGIRRETVGHILSQQEVVEKIAQCQARLFDLVPKAISVYEEALNSDNLPLATATATKLLEGTQVLNKNGIEEITKLANQASPERAAEERQPLMMGRITMGSLEKSRVYKRKLTPKMEELVVHCPGAYHTKRERC